MKSRLFVTLVALLGLFAVGAAQLTQEQKDTSRRVLEKIRRVEIYNQILPVLMTPEQIKALLPILEMHRAEAVKLEEFEYTTLRGFESRLDAALAQAKEKGELPDKEVIKSGVVYFQAFSMKRKALLDDTVEQLIAKMKEKLNEGQIRAAANAFDPAILLSTIKPEELTDDKKLDFWVRIVLMDNAAYEILVDLSKKKQPAPEHEGPLLGFGQ